VVTPDQQVSPQTRELADLLGRVVQEYEKAHPTVTGTEVSQALRLARRASTKAAGGEAMAIKMAVALGLVFLGGLAAFFFVARGGDFNVDMVNAQVMVAIIALGIAGAFVAILKRRE
jgi:hypothetical protein